ncbi:hypothetical protein GCM10007063_27050 [Lentibacillus kapialis]|uniref:DUF1468 domain-containing protein n=1 Tax=Lentibacillus kapialis TaxID=340214 RepID=A0A917Q047_9BACI|nr:hypothetical protein GCM10007063_27050 [Lentibacillus kapialis]
MVLLIITIVFYTQTVDLPERAAMFPTFVLGLLLFFSIAIIIMGVTKTIKEKKGDPVYYVEEEERLKFKTIKLPLVFLIILAIYIVAMNFLGFFVTTTLLIVLTLYILHSRKLTTCIFTVFGTNLFIYFLFVFLLNVNLPQGIFF